MESKVLKFLVVTLMIIVSVNLAACNQTTKNEPMYKNLSELLAAYGDYDKIPASPILSDGTIIYNTSEWSPQDVETLNQMIDLLELNIPKIETATTRSTIGDSSLPNDNNVVYKTFDELYAVYGSDFPRNPQGVDGQLLYDYNSWSQEDKDRFDYIIEIAEYASNITVGYDEFSSNSSDSTKYLGTYSMISSNPYLGADLEIYVASEDGKTYLFGIADYEYSSGEVFGELQIIDAQHFYFKDAESGAVLELTYDPETSILTVTETGNFGGMNITFAGRYAQTSGAIIS